MYNPATKVLNNVIGGSSCQKVSKPATTAVGIY